VLVVLATTACVAPVTQMGSVSREDVRAEQFRQQQLVVRASIKDQQRVDNVGYALLKAAVPICGPGATSTRAGVRFSNVYTFNKDYQPAARALGFSDTLTVVGVAKGSAAERSGVAVGDRIVGIGGGAAPVGRNAVRDAGTTLARLRNADSDFGFQVLHGSLALTTAGAVSQEGQSTVSIDTAPVRLTVPPDTVCDYGISAIKEDALNAWADGKNVYVTSAMLRFAADDEELAVVLSHEISHNAMRHIDAKKKNAAIGAIFGAILDIAAASQGVNTGGEFTNDMAAAASMAFSQDFEREADYVGLYVLARAARPIGNSPDFWRRMAQEAPGSIKFASSHPTTAERFLRLEKTVTEIDQKRASGAALLPEMKQK
jgi:hypothetical protein